MIIFTTQTSAEATVVRLYGDLAPEDSVPMLADHLDALAASGDLIVDLTDLGVARSTPVEELTRHLATAAAQHRTVVIGPETSLPGRSLEVSSYATHHRAPRHRAQIEEA